MEDRFTDIAERTARLVAATERSRASAGPSLRRSKGNELEEALRLAAAFPTRQRGRLEYPVLKHLVKSRASKQG